MHNVQQKAYKCMCTKHYVKHYILYYYCATVEYVNMKYISLYSEYICAYFIVHSSYNTNHI